ncbi:MAG: hypothetical protein LWX09_04805 [Bacteroidia bacterium]|nr:hypothetical protein [Bacteroidia bacterium]
MEKIILPDNHRRSLSSSLYIVEKLLDEIEQALTHPDDGFMYKMEVDVPEHAYRSTIENIALAKQMIEHLHKKYELSAQHSMMSRFIDSRKSKIWEILSGTNARGMKGYGPFPKEYAQEFDNDIKRLQEMVNKV